MEQPAKRPRHTKDTAEVIGEAGNGSLGQYERRQKTTKYTEDLEFGASSDGDNDMLGDVSAMVKGIGCNTGEGVMRLYRPPSLSRPSSSRSNNEMKDVRTALSAPVMRSAKLTE